MSAVGGLLDWVETASIEVGLDGGIGDGVAKVWDKGIRIGKR